jgi:hypothetical protein
MGAFMDKCKMVQAICRDDFVASPERPSIEGFHFHAEARQALFVGDESNRQPRPVSFRKGELSHQSIGNSSFRQKPVRR